jgi:tetratricopeptide (TPR) repeat protein/predicted Ser/Thr protein kinase
VSDLPSMTGMTEPIEPEAASARGKVVDRYVIVDEVGAGGMGVVYKAYDPDLGRVIALKLVGKARTARSTARLEREARAIAKLSHPNVVAVHDVGRSQEQLFIAMEYVSGASLTTWLTTERRSQRQIVDIFLQTARGLAAAHDAGLIHRDFKPDNVLVGVDGRARVADFGLAYVDASESVSDEGGLVGSPELTPPGAPVGTPRYMSPEQHRGQRVDPRADQFSWGVSLYEALTRQRAYFGADVAEIRRSVLAGQMRDIPPGAAVPTWLRSLVQRVLRTDPAERFPSMHEIIAELERDRGVDRRGTLDGSANTDPMIAAFPPPDDHAGRVEALRAKLDQAWAKKSRGAWTASLATCREVLDGASELGYAPLTAAALYLRGNLEHRTGSPETARETLYAAARIAARAGDDWQLANVWVFLVLVVGTGLGNLDEAGALGRVAEVAIARVGDNASLRSRLHNYRGAALIAANRYEDAAGELERAVAVDRETHGADHAFTAVSLLNLAEVWLDAGKPERAREPLAIASTIVQPTAPPPTTARVRARALRARAALAEGQLEAARADLEVVIDVWSRQPGRTRALADALVDLAACLRRQGNLVGAETTARRAVSLAKVASDQRVCQRADRELALTTAAASGR